jgi:hypothetical protein
MVVLFRFLHHNLYMVIVVAILIAVTVAVAFLLTLC